MNKGFRDLIAWQKAYELVLEIYKLSRRFPRHEQYGFTSQICRAAVSVPGNIAEGYERQHRREYIRFLIIAKGSLGELETYLLLAQDLGYVNIFECKNIDLKRKEVAKVLNGLIRSLRAGSWALATGP